MLANGLTGSSDEIDGPLKRRKAKRNPKISRRVVFA
jgi:hypothetical protein